MADDQPKKKLPYEKPMMVIERFELTQSISNCDIKANFNPYGCELDLPGAQNVFNMHVNGCSPIYWNQTSNEQYYGTCYYVNNGYNGFNS